MAKLEEAKDVANFDKIIEESKGFVCLDLEIPSMLIYLACGVNNVANRVIFTRLGGSDVG